MFRIGCSRHGHDLTLLCLQMRGVPRKYYVLHLYCTLADNFVVDLAITNLYHPAPNGPSLGTIWCHLAPNDLCARASDLFDARQAGE